MMIYGLVFPVMFLWCEYLLRCFGGKGGAALQMPVILTALGAGAFCAAAVLWLAERSKKAAAVLSAAILVLTALIFAVESTILSVFTTYMSPGNLLSGAGNVLENYRGEFLRSLLPGTTRFLLFLLPGLLFAGACLFRRRAARKEAEKANEAAEKAGPETETGPAKGIAGGIDGARAAVLLTTAGILLTGCGTNLVRSGPDAELYGTHYNYNAAVETFGLLMGERLDVVYSLFGLPETVFSGSGSAQTALSADASAPSDGAASDTAASDEAAPSDAATASDAATSSDAEVEEEPVYGDNAMEIDFSAEALHSTKALDGLTQYVSSLTPSKQNRYTGLFRGKNLILICAEAYCDRFIRPELTPTLWRLTHNGFYFEEYYQSEWGGSTTTGEMAFLTGLGGNNGDESLSGIAGNNHFFTMGNQLQRLGYSSIAFHSGSHTYYRRHTTHENLGYDTFLASGNGLQKRIGYSYAPDTVLVDATTDLYLGHEPFSVYYMTISGHAPYVRKNPLVSKYYDRVNEAVGDEYAEKTKYYICYQMELEEAMKLLVERLEEAGIADDTVIALTGDHYPYGLGGGSTWQNDRDYIKDLLHGSDYYRWEQDRSGLIIWCGSLEHADRDMARTVSDPVGNLDILPTLSNLFGLEFDSRLLPGRDVLDPETQPLVVWNNLSFVTREGKYDGRKGGWHPNEGFEWTETDPDYLPRMHSLVNDRLLMSRLIAQTDYYGLLFGPDEVTQAGDVLWDPENIVPWEPSGE